MKWATMVAPLALAALAAAPAGANDSTSELAAGGLVLTKSAAIEMRSEDLYISEARVRVRYSFVNTTPAPITVTVAFPLPNITTNGYDDMFSVPVDSATDFLGFSTLVDGQPVKMQLEQRAMQRGLDRTALLRRLGVPLAPWRKATGAALSRLPRARQDELVKLGLAVDSQDQDQGPTVRLHLEGVWTLKTTFYWTQTFPPGRPLAVEHSYTPSVGSYVTTELAPLRPSPDPDQAKAQAKARRDYCVGDDLMATVRDSQKPPATMPLYYDNYLEYVLVTGANWKGPIGDFHMTIDKGSAANLVSFCGEGVRKTRPTTFEVRYANFTPARNVKVLLLKPRPN